MTRAASALAIVLGVIITCGGSALAGAQQVTPATPDSTKPRITVGGFVDAYYAYDANAPATLDRAFTTQAARHNEFNVNLAFIDATLAAPRARGRFAAQFGTSVQANYAAEPRLGTLSGPDVSRYIQEAFGGYRVAPAVWIDAGIFFSPFGSENWISRDNWTYTRSLIADNSPYYEAGVRATWQATPALGVQVHIINGWQNVSESNGSKAVGVRLDYAPSPRVALAYDGFLGNEAPDSVPRRLRAWQEGIVTLRLARQWQVRGTLDYGTQRRADSAGAAPWRGFAVLARYEHSPRLAASARVEGYSDPEQVIVTTGPDVGLRATGSSFTVDVTPEPYLTWRTEARLLRARDAIFPVGRSTAPGRSDAVVLTAMLLTL